MWDNWLSSIVAARGKPVCAIRDIPPLYPPRYGVAMASERDDDGERQARISRMIREFQAAQERRLMQRGIGLWKRTEATQLARIYGPKPPAEKIH